MPTLIESASLYPLSWPGGFRPTTSSSMPRSKDVGGLGTPVHDGRRDAWIITNEILLSTPRPSRRAADPSRPCARRSPRSGSPARCTALPAGRRGSTDGPSRSSPASTSSPKPGSIVRRPSPSCGQLAPWPCWLEVQRGASSADCGSAPRSIIAVSTCRLTCTWLSAPGVPSTAHSRSSLNTIGAFIVWRTRLPGARRLA